MLITLTAIVLALLLDQWLGETRRYHPLVGFGRLANALEKKLNRAVAIADNSRLPRNWGALELLHSIFSLTLTRRERGLLALLCMVGAPLLGALLLCNYLALAWWPLQVCGQAVILYVAIGRQSLREHALAVANALQRNDIVVARRAVSRIVTRDTERADAATVSSAAVETVLENGSDALFASLFWFIVAGLPGAVVHRAANTLDAMWGYRTERFNEFGWAAARFDDLLNYIPARLTAVAYALSGQTQRALHCWRTQAPLWSSPNAGPVMAAGAGALGLQLGGAAIYNGVVEIRPPLGSGRAAQPGDIRRALHLLDRSLAIWLGVLVLFAGAMHWLI
ncbi:MAG TPA: adenosylcobinamide-phosphate synthase CbiB [Spongiibacteraceae bacterium]|nr:adenosylcobinamide-phosphate synthase CbiB [Spongiibacteraceae bacterium]